MSFNLQIKTQIECGGGGGKKERTFVGRPKLSHQSIRIEESLTQREGRVVGDAN